MSSAPPGAVRRALGLAALAVTLAGCDLGPVVGSDPPARVADAYPSPAAVVTARPVDLPPTTTATPSAVPSPAATTAAEPSEVATEPDAATP